MACNSSRVIEPLKKGQTQVSAGLGGPLFYLTDNLLIPMPLTEVSVAHGLSEKMTGFASIHTTSLAFGNLQTDFGICKSISAQKGYVPGVSANIALNYMYNLEHAVGRAFPQIDVNTYWHYNQKPHFIYAGIGNWFDFTQTRSFNEPQNNHHIFMFQLGHKWNSTKWVYTAEMKWLQPFSNNQRIVVDYIGIQHQGALGIYFGIGRNF